MIEPVPLKSAGSHSDRSSEDNLRLPPQSVEAEQSLLGALLLDNRLIDQISSEIETRDFYRADHRKIYEIILALYERSEPIDVLTVSEAMSTSAEGSSENVGSDLAYLGSLAKNTPNTGNALPYARIVRDRAVLRRLIETANDISRTAYNPEGLETDAVLDRAEQAIFEIARQESRGSEGFKGIGPLLAESLNRIEQLFESGDSVTGLPTGFIDLDEMTSGLQEADLVVVAGRPSMGKTSFAMNLVEHIAIDQNKPVAVFSMEMPGNQLATRMLASLSRVGAQKLRSGKLNTEDWPRLTSVVNMLSGKPIYIDDTPALTALEIRTRARRLASEHENGLGAIMVDYLQLMQGGEGNSDNRATEISAITRALKSLAKELSVPIIVLSQLNRSLEQRPNKRPIMSDLRESGAIEQDADLIIFIYRDEVYNEDSEAKGTAEIIVGKQRNGPIGTTRLTFLGEFTRFENYSGTGFSGGF
ncbi:MAG: replicative DNA helicase [Proteobacteria bacterium]|nr:replicative DNA helicase [Pseudomonadota bacterium]